jgi:valyl-tRNA synthetase
VWYPIGSDAQIDYARPIVPSEAQLPIDPSTDTPEGYVPAQRNQPNGFAGDPDIMDTWATSSLTPQIAGDWLGDPDLFARVFPMDLRPQAHDIIRTWLFTTVLRSQLEHSTLPWRHTAISGFVTDPDRKKMSKSKGNVITPLEFLKEYGSDGVRYWAANVRPGGDGIFDVGEIKVGRRLAIKMLNAAKFALMQAEPRGPITEPLDRGMLSSLSALVKESTDQFEAYDYSKVLEQSERFFWSFCDDYLELVKARRYGDFTPEGAASANSAMLVALSTLLRLFAPFLPFVTEEVWSWWRPGSVHNARWPTADEVVASIGGSDVEAVQVFGQTRAALGEIRRIKALEKRPVKAVIDRAVLPQRFESLMPAAPDFKAAAHIRDLSFGPAEVPQLEFAADPLTEPRV